MLAPWQPIGQVSTQSTVNIDVAVPGGNLTLNSLCVSITLLFSKCCTCSKNCLFPLNQFPICQFPFGQLPKGKGQGSQMLRRSVGYTRMYTTCTCINPTFNRSSTLQHSDVIEIHTSWHSQHTFRSSAVRESSLAVISPGRLSSSPTTSLRFILAPISLLHRLRSLFQLSV